MSDSPSYWITLLLISPPLGWLGSHHFYLGRKKRAAMYVLLFVTGIPVLLATIDTLILLKKGREGFIEEHGTKEDMDEYYIRKLLNRRPEMLTENLEKRQQYISEVTEKKDVNQVIEKEEETNEDDKEDYEEYYGNWD
jgi:TM2 domain-containing membrane protein YozV